MPKKLKKAKAGAPTTPKLINIPSETYKEVTDRMAREKAGLRALGAQTLTGLVNRLLYKYGKGQVSAE